MSIPRLWLLANVLPVLLAWACSSSSMTAPQIPSPSGIVGYIGCSNTWQTVAGYHDFAGGSNIWEADPNYGGGDVVSWASDISNNNFYWSEFAKLYAGHPETKNLWIQFCVKSISTYD